MKEETIMKLLKSEMDGFLLGLDRIPVPECNRKKSHIYKGEFNSIEKPMCPKGYNRSYGFSIWRNHAGAGICKNCIKNTVKYLLIKKLTPTPNN